MTEKSGLPCQQTDRRFMEMALTMARRGFGTTAPNPCVGAVIVDTRGVICGRGWTQPGGRPHAEVEALARAGDRARGATLYVTLEPCSHTGKSPPCADAVIKAGIRRVVVGLFDPDERVAGRGVERLKEAAIEVDEDVMAGEPALLKPALGHVLRIMEQRPFVQLKLATSRDGLIAPGEGKPVWVTGEQARARGHLLRAQADAILVGAGTVRADNPSLDCRLPGLESRSPVRVVMDSQLSMSPQSAMLQMPQKAPVWIVHGGKAGSRTVKGLTGQGAQLIKVAKHKTNGLDLPQTLEALAARGITRLLVEGGPTMARSFVKAKLVDEVVLFRGAQSLEGSGLSPFVDRGLELLREEGFKEVDRRAVGPDEMQILAIGG